MNTRITAVLVALILLAIALDYFIWGTGGLIFVLRKFTDLIEYLAFWR